jgi:hypothetical protein
VHHRLSDSFELLLRAHGIKVVPLTLGFRT